MSKETKGDPRWRMHHDVQHYQPVPARSAWAMKPHQGLSDHRVALTQDAIRQSKSKRRVDRCGLEMRLVTRGSRGCAAVLWVGDMRLVVRLAM
ncbi:hypothetical protein CORC01_11505 [Colletotrichum orchidophilum]|uniref:Uncharacterized protein n=1 Tax=Colletotrichum orchidophilum TaxID=1209926 RepID=A0A1G4AVJ8_9PEZI|nr:uncharacterized protein CORC01_11505 [Colletotrichum orchidophilum]OHE93188.1 hypothetical protein CORC01_11505 [Colletotrichum orchidophilum]